MFPYIYSVIQMNSGSVKIHDQVVYGIETLWCCTKGKEFTTQDGWEMMFRIDICLNIFFAQYRLVLNIISRIIVVCHYVIDCLVLLSNYVYSTCMILHNMTYLFTCCVSKSSILNCFRVLGWLHAKSKNHLEISMQRGKNSIEDVESGPQRQLGKFDF